MKNQVKRIRCAYGSFEIFKGKPEDLQIVWSCGKGTGIDLCVHATKKDAEQCDRPR